ncbi:MAG: permease-like cell division protein FtsX [Pseudomonadota bacterium]
MFLRRGAFFLGKAIQGLGHGFLINCITIGTIAISLLVVSTFLIVFLNLSQFLNKWKDEVQVTAYLDDSISVENMMRIKKKIADFRETKAVKYISKEEAIDILKKSLQTDDSFFQGLTTNPLPPSFEIQLKERYLSSNRVENFVARVKKFKEIKDVEYDQEWIAGFSAFLNLFRIGGLMLGTGLLLAAVFIISNTIRLSVYARRDELEIMRLVGATNLFIKAPFFLEGLLHGLIGALLSIGLLYAMYRVFISSVGSSFSPYFGGLDFSFLPLNFGLAIVFGGMVIGMFSSMVSLRRFLKT